MGIYMYRVTAKTIKLDDGRIAHVAKYAYKPYRSIFDNKENARLHFASGCVASERLTLKSDLITTLDPADADETGTLYHNKRSLRVFLDDATFGTEHMPRLGSVRRDGKKFVVEA